MALVKIIDPKNLSSKVQDHIKAGNPLIVTKYEDKKTGRMRGKEGRIIWDGKNFIFVPEKVML
jgi:hypothetical protein